MYSGKGTYTTLESDEEGDEDDGGNEEYDSQGGFDWDRVSFVEVSLLRVCEKFAQKHHITAGKDAKEEEKEGGEGGKGEDDGDEDEDEDEEYVVDGWKKICEFVTN
jgi:hypothetical protein